MNPVEKVDHNIADVFGIDPTPESQRINKVIEPYEPSMSVCDIVPRGPLEEVIEDQLARVIARSSTDSNYARGTTLELLSHAMAQIKILTAIAEESEEPRAYEVLAQWVNIAIGLSTQQMNISAKVIKDLGSAKNTIKKSGLNKGIGVSGSGGNIVGTTSSIREMLLDKDQNLADITEKKET